MTEPLTPQQATLAQECGTLGPETTEDIIAILVRMCPGFDVVAFQQVAGGRRWYVPSPQRRSLAERRAAIRSDPCRDYKVISRRYGVSVALVYEVWNEKTG
jgi:Mor family transcriptional regulator